MFGLLKSNLSKLPALNPSVKHTFAGIKTTHAVIIKQAQPIKQEFTREYLTKLQQNPNFMKEEQQMQQIILEKQKNDQIFQNKFNDRNESNFLKTIKIRQPQEQSIQLVKQENDSQTTNPFIIKVQPKKERVSVHGIRRNVQSSLKKLYGPAKSIIKLHIFDALNLLSQSDKQTSRHIKSTLNQTIDHAKNHNLDINRLWVWQVMIGKQRRFQKLRYHAKMRMGRVTTDICQIKILLEEKPVEEVFKLFLKGKTPATMAAIMRERIVQQNMDFEKIQEYQYMLTAKGRQQKKLMIKRKVQAKFMEFQQKGVWLESGW